MKFDEKLGMLVLFNKHLEDEDEINEQADIMTRALNRFHNQTSEERKQELSQAFSEMVDAVRVIASNYSLKTGEICIMLAKHSNMVLEMMYHAQHTSESDESLSNKTSGNKTDTKAVKDVIDKCNKIISNGGGGHA